MADNEEIQEELPTETEVTETQEVEIQEPAPFRAWELKPKEQTSKSVPYDRFSDVLNERDTHARRAQELEAEVTRLTAPLTKEQRKTVDDIKLDDFTDPQEYIRAIARAAKEEAREEIRNELSQSQQQSQHQEHFQKLTNTYMENLDRSFKSNSEIREAVATLDKYSDYIHPDIAYELMIDENAGELMHKIATDKELFTELFKGNPNDFIRKLHKISAKITREDTSDAVVEARPDPRAQARATIPTPIRPVPGKPSKDPAKMSLAEYRAYVANGYK